MKRVLHALALVLAWPMLVQAGEEIVIKPLTSAPESESEVFFEIKDGTVRVDGELIQEFSVRENRVSVAYKNTTHKGMFPKFVLRIYNAYGILIGSEEVSVSFFGGPSRLEPGDIGGGQLGVDWLDLEKIMVHAVSGELPADFGQAKWLSIADSNSKLFADPGDPGDPGDPVEDAVSG